MTESVASITFQELNESIVIVVPSDSNQSSIPQLNEHASLVSRSIKSRPIHIVLFYKVMMVMMKCCCT